VAWFAGLFYMPRLFVYHTKTHDDQSYQLFCTMEKRLYGIIILPATVMVLLTGTMLVYLNPVRYLMAGYFRAKLLIVFLLLIFLVRCHWHMVQFLNHKNNYSEMYYRCFNEVPTVLLISAVVLVVVKPI
tara:strand:+ start:306 stop:692 length:387 start_codon:yes stop_codon:yes gene_type:complete